MARNAVTILFDEVRSQATPQNWSGGVAIVRQDQVFRESGALAGSAETEGPLTHSASTQETNAAEPVELLVKAVKDVVAARVGLFPEEETWSSDCNCKDDPCAHIAAAVIALKNGQISLLAPSSRGSIGYSFFSATDGFLQLRRLLSDSQGSWELKSTLTEYLGGIRSGRTSGADIVTTREDFLIDDQLKQSKIPLPRATLRIILELLRGRDGITLNGVAVTVSPELASIQAELVDDGRGVRLRHCYSVGEGQTFRNGAHLANMVLYVLKERKLSLETQALLTPPGKHFSGDGLSGLVGSILPRLQRELPVIVRTKALPSKEDLKPHLIFDTVCHENDLVVTPRIVYGDPPVAEVHGEQLLTHVRSVAFERDIAAERGLTLQLLRDYGWRVGLPQWKRDVAGVEFVMATHPFKLVGSDLSQYQIQGTLQFEVNDHQDGLSSRFFNAGGAVESSAVFRAWQDQKPYVKGANGQWFAVPLQWLTVHGEFLARLLASESAEKRGSKALYLELDAVDAKLSDELRSALRAFVDDLNNQELPENTSATPSSHFAGHLPGYLRDYQRIGVQWLCKRLSHGVGVLLADDMGLGKTLQALLSCEGSTLIVAPTSVLANWTDHLKRFRSEDSWNLFHGAARQLNDAQFIITSYAILRRDIALLAHRSWDTIVLDESQNIKNPESQISQAVFTLAGMRRIALSGTPVENSLENLWSQFRFLNPGLLGDRKHFDRHFSTPIAQGEATRGEQLRRIVLPFVLRRTKEEVASELPEKTELLIHCELDSEERVAYDALATAARTEVRALLEEGGSVISALEIILRLRQCCCHRGLLPGFSEIVDSTKLSVLIDGLQTAVNSRHKALVFSQWTSFLDKIEPKLQQAELPYLRLDGSTIDRSGVVSQFQASDGPPILLLSLKAGGVGITLTEADYVYILDPWWNPAVEQQAADRAHRIGQTRPVLIQKLVIADSIEERIIELQRSKKALAEMVLTGGSIESSLSKEDLLFLLRE